MNNTQCHGEDSFLKSQQLLSYSFNSLSFTEHTGSLLFSTQPDSHPSPNFFNLSTICSHTYSSLNNNANGAHRFCALQTPCWHTKPRDKKVRDWQIIEPLTYHTNLKLAQTTPVEPQNSNFTHPILKYILYKNSKLTQKLFEDDKHNPQDKMLVLNWHNHKSNRTKVKKGRGGIKRSSYRSQRLVLPEKLTVAHLLEHIGSLLFSPQPDSHPLTSSLQPIYHLFSHISLIEQHS